MRFLNILFNTFIGLIILVSCNQSKKNPPVISDFKYRDLLGRNLICETSSGPAYLIIYSPHIIGIWSENKKYMIEYFRSIGLSPKKELYFESFLLGARDFRTVLKIKGAKENRRLKLSIKGQKIHLLVADGLDEKRKPIRPQKLKCIRGKILSNFFSPPRSRPQ